MPEPKTKNQPKKKTSVKTSNSSAGKIDHVTEAITKALNSENPVNGLDKFPLPGGKKRTDKYYTFLHELAKHSKFAIDVGTCEGASAFVMASASLECQVLTLDVENKVQAELKEMKNVEFVEAEAVGYLTTSKFDDPDLVFIDAEPDPTLVLSLFDAHAPRMKKRGVIVVDDVLWFRQPKFVEWWLRFQPNGWEKITVEELHQTEQAGVGILVKQ